MHFYFPSKEEEQLNSLKRALCEAGGVRHTRRKWPGQPRPGASYTRTHTSLGPLFSALHSDSSRRAKGPIVRTQNWYPTLSYFQWGSTGDALFIPKRETGSPPAQDPALGEGLVARSRDQVPSGVPVPKGVLRPSLLGTWAGRSRQFCWVSKHLEHVGVCFAGPLLLILGPIVNYLEGSNISFHPPLSTPPPQPIESFWGTEEPHYF